MKRNHSNRALIHSILKIMIDEYLITEHERELLIKTKGHGELRNLCEDLCENLK